MRWAVEFHGEIEVEADSEDQACQLALQKVSEDGISAYMSVEAIDVTPEMDCGAGGA